MNSYGSLTGRAASTTSSFNLPRLLIALSLSLYYSGLTLAQPATLQFYDCFTGNASQKLSVDTVYAQYLPNEVLNITVLGQASQQILGTANTTSLSTLFTESTTLTFNSYSNNSYLCSSIRPPSPLPSLSPNETTYCPIPAGPFAFSTIIPSSLKYALTTLNTELRAVDPFGVEILCLDVSTTVLEPGPLGSPYGRAHIIFWATVGLAIAYWLVVGIARIVSAWNRGISRPGPGVWHRVESAGFILASAISGERLATSPALMRFCSPSMRDIIFHTQWCAALSMIAVQWPPFVYPLLAQTGWAALSYNITLTQGNGANDHWSPLAVQPYSPPSDFADQLNDSTSPIYIDPSVPNSLFLLPPNTNPGIESYAYSVGLRPQDLFGICVGLFLAIVAGTIVISFAVWMIDWAFSSPPPNSNTGLPAKLGGTRSPRLSAGSKDMLENAVGGIVLGSPDENRSLNGHYMLRSAPRFPGPRVGRWKLPRPDISSFHFSVLLGNLVRILVLFHLPVTIFSSYQLALGARQEISTASVALAALSFAILSVLLPVFLLIRLMRTTTNKLYDETRTLLVLGPLYNHYRHGSQLFACLLFCTNLIFGVTIGAGQGSGTTQAVIILVVEVVSALVTSVWLPWGAGASMGLISFLFCVARIVIAVLLVILTPTISIGDGAGGWVAYGILCVLCLVYLAFFLMLVVKLIEAAVRIAGRIGFDRSKHAVDSGLIGACGLMGCCGPRKHHRSRPRHPYKSTTDSYRPTEPSLSSYSPPTANFAQKESSASHHSHHSGPPSVLRPEHALRPYKEDSDDEGGFIMGAWQPFPRPGYAAIDEARTSISAPPTPPASGFSRVGGGRAHYDSPYAIASGSTLTFPSVERNSGSASGRAVPPMFDEGEENVLTQPSASVASVQIRMQSLPHGAMIPHVRTKSQTAIIENAGIPTPSSAVVMNGSPGKVPSDPSIPENVDTGSASKKRHWFNIRRNRRHSEGDILDTQDEETGSSTPPPPKETGRSFVVIRDRKPQSSSQPDQPTQQIQQVAEAAGIATGSTSPTERPKSFVVLRGKDS
ncbi:hypothetical protein SERLA73DRAFT_117887 [Serpula lacrymans var. lacrymans S7.3]|uniref:TRP C-terminal domain-containing protein n=2 Tax=Serpula lacrymans var. lacrymans TaxID=341189 RepID=F8QI35_SERL3|nr:uncharacterized protein SERLADRAFT_462367 [Serpula lacrymans var. lacrymans S7.9]EGN92046.1 hypothetical protein SERLA73DRAFT_117887 [Serpula lacrymans var. lacrymans S7.3]EGO27991.1 hypothetical protein SERLADRAFT_462367 [Serpula lacrymans var. lacrymans S7.9]